MPWSYCGDYVTVMHNVGGMALELPHRTLCLLAQCARLVLRCGIMPSATVPLCLRLHQDMEFWEHDNSKITEVGWTLWDNLSRQLVSR